jgi:hypothetical protein
VPIGALRSKVVGFNGWNDKFPNRFIGIDLEAYKLYLKTAITTAIVKIKAVIRTSKSSLLISYSAR